MNGAKITRFEFPNLEKDYHQVIIEEVTEVQHDHEELEPEKPDFIEQNVLSEIGHNPQQKEQENENLVTISREELEQMRQMIAQARVPVVEEKHPESEPRQLQVIQAQIAEIRTRVDVELEGLVGRIIDLSHAIATKLVDGQTALLQKEGFASIITKKLEELDFHSDFSITVKDEEVAEILRQNGIAVSVNNDMLPGDYKVVWCNGFLERNTAEIAAQIEEIFNHQIKKN